MTKRDALETYLESLPSRHSRRTMRSRLDAAAAILTSGATAETFDWSSVDFAGVTKVLGALNRAKAAPATVNLTRAALRGLAKTLFGLNLMSAAERMRIGDVRAARGFRLPKRTVLEQKEIRKLFRACTRNTPATTAARDSALLAVLYGAGLRREEASQLDVDDFHGNTLRVCGKGNQERLAPIGADAARAVKAWIKMRGTGGKALFLPINKGGTIGKGRLSGDAIFYSVQKLADRASISTISPHSLRRSFVTTLLEQGEDLGTAAKAAGHRSISTTAIYDRRDGKKVAAAVGRLVVPFGR